jgi:hypothetical protein
MLYEQRTQLAGLELPGDLPPQQRLEIQQAVADSSVSGYRRIMGLAACLAAAGAASTWLLIGKQKES